MIRLTPITNTDTLKRAIRERRCSNCGCVFRQERMGQQVCSFHCASSYARRLREQKERIQTREAKAKLKTRQDWQREAQTAINAYVRARDAALPCISCGRHHQGQYHAGHYLARGSHPHLALVETNLAKQCAPCNTYLSGNQLKFRVGLIERIGLAAVETLEADQAPRRHTIDDLRAIRDTYRKRAAQLKKEMT
jgi:hypothetical protein